MHSNHFTVVYFQGQIQHLSMVLLPWHGLRLTVSAEHTTQTWPVWKKNMTENQCKKHGTCWTKGLDQSFQRTMEVTPHLGTGKRRNRIIEINQCSVWQQTSSALENGRTGHVRQNLPLFATVQVSGNPWFKYSLLYYNLFIHVELR